MGKHVYITQYGGWWKATTVQWEVIVRKGVAGQEYDLSNDAKPLFNQPKSVHKDKHLGLWCNKGTEIFQPLDWNAYDWANALAEIESKRD